MTAIEYDMTNKYEKWWQPLVKLTAWLWQVFTIALVNKPLFYLLRAFPNQESHYHCGRLPPLYLPLLFLSLFDPLSVGAGQGHILPIYFHGTLNWHISKPPSFTPFFSYFILIHMVHLYRISFNLPSYNLVIGLNIYQFTPRYWSIPEHSGMIQYIIVVSGTNCTPL